MKETKNKIANAYVNGYWKGFRDGFYFMEKDLKEFDPCAWHKDLQETFTCTYCHNTKSDGFYMYVGDPSSTTKPTTNKEDK